MQRPVILTCCDGFLPGAQCSGPVTSVANLVEHLGQEFEFRVLTRPLESCVCDGQSWPTSSGNWESIDGTQAFLAPGGVRGNSEIYRVLRDTDYDVLYLNSQFSPALSILPMLCRKLGRLPDRPVIIGPRGELSPGALEIRSWKKHAFLRFAKAIKLHRDVIWQASGELEASHIRSVFGRDVKIVVAPDLSAKVEEKINWAAYPSKQSGRLRLVFVSRISPKKNLDELLHVLQQPLKGEIELTIAGPAEDKAHWSDCQALIRRLPPNVSVNYVGAVPPAEVSNVMRQHDFFVLLTRGENFGHVIVEAMAAGCPVLISQETQWRQLLSQQAGFDVPLDDRDQVVRTLARCLAMEQQEHLSFRQGAVRYAKNNATREEDVNRNRQLFNDAFQWRPAAQPARWAA